MDKFLKPERFDADPNSSTAVKQWLHWHRTFSNFLAAFANSRPNKLNMLINHVTPSVYEYIAECETYDAAVDVLKALYVKPKNEVFARHVLATRRQEAGEKLDQYMQVLKQLSKDCNFQDATAEQWRNDSIRDAFINGLQSAHIRQRLLEDETLSLKTAFDQARALEMAQKHSESFGWPAQKHPESFGWPVPPVNAAAAVEIRESSQEALKTIAAAHEVRHPSYTWME